MSRFERHTNAGGSAGSHALPQPDAPSERTCAQRKSLPSRGRHPPRLSLQTEGGLQEAARALAREGKLGLLETLYPTRCAICDQLGTLLCDACRLNLPWIDKNLACDRCGAAWGKELCTECNPLSLAAFGLDEPPFDTAAHALMYNENTQRLIRAYKDEGEQRLAREIGRIMAQYVSPEVRANVQALTYIPASKAALRKRGFDQMQLIAHVVSDELGLPVAAAFDRPRSKDQRELGMQGRMRNMRDVFIPHPQARLQGARLLLADDVMTTGSTIYAAVSTLKAAGAAQVHVITLARVYGES